MPVGTAEGPDETGVEDEDDAAERLAEGAGTWDAAVGLEAAILMFAEVELIGAGVEGGIDGAADVAGGGLWEGEAVEAAAEAAAEDEKD